MSDQNSDKTKALQAALAQVPSLDPQSIEDLICGCAIPEGQQGLNIARIGAVLAGLPTSVGGITVNRFCASGLSAVQMAADRIRVGEADVMIAAGVESMSMVPMMGNTPSLSPAIFQSDDVGIAYGMGLTAEKVAAQWKVSREAQDAFALQSHQRALAAQAAGYFDAETTPFEIIDRVPNLVTGEIELKTRIARSVTISKQRYKLAMDLHVIDNGPGIPEDISERIFFPLVSGREGGSGLGLTLAQTFVQQHQGFIACDSRPGRTDFHIQIPYRRQEKNS